MDIAILGKNSLKLKGKQATFVIDPTSAMPKTPADAIILLGSGLDTDITRVTDSRIIINGPGGYEVGGVKISGLKTSKGILYKFSIDDVVIILGSPAETNMEGFSACQVAVINTNSDFNESFVTGLEPKITVLYGDNKTEAAKTLGAENITSVPKITIAKDKLPEKMEIVVLASS